MDNQQQAAALNQLSRLLFNQAALRWQLSLGVQFVAGIVGLIVSLVAPPVEASAAWALVVMLLLAVSYWLRFSFESSHDVAEIMRRQSVLSEGLDWPISRAQFNEWRSRAGKKLLNHAAKNPRPDDYYATKTPAGPKRLAEMTFESLFWTKNLYRKLQLYIGAFLAIVILILVAILIVSPLVSHDQATRIYLAYAVYLVVPVLISVDAVGLLMRLHRAITALSAIEPHIETLAGQTDPPVAELMRLLSEYNSTVATGVPIPNWVFSRHHDEIQGYWD